MIQTCNCGRPTSGAWLCPNCATTLRWALINTSAHHGDLDTLARKQARYGTTGATKGSIGKEQPLPIDGRFAGTNADGSQLRWDTRNTITTWTRTLQNERPTMHGPACEDCDHKSCDWIHRSHPPKPTVASMVLYLSRNLDHILTRGWVVNLLDELLDLERRLTRMIDRPADKWYAGTCSAEDENGACNVDLYARQDRGTIDCPGCGIQHDVGERRGFLLDQAQEYLVTATEAAGALLAWTDYDGSETKLVDRIRKWRDREQLDVAEVTSLSGRDRHLYRLGDIQDLLIQAAQRRSEKVA